MLVSSNQKCKTPADRCFSHLRHSLLCVRWRLPFCVSAFFDLPDRGQEWELNSLLQIQGLWRSKLLPGPEDIVGEQEPRTKRTAEDNRASRRDEAQQASAGGHVDQLEVYEISRPHPECSKGSWAPEEINGGDNDGGEPAEALANGTDSRGGPGTGAFAEQMGLQQPARGAALSGFTDPITDVDVPQSAEDEQATTVPRADSLPAVLSPGPPFLASRGRISRPQRSGTSPRPARDSLVSRARAERLASTDSRRTKHSSDQNRNAPVPSRALIPAPRAAAPSTASSLALHIHACTFDGQVCSNTTSSEITNCVLSRTMSYVIPIATGDKDVSVSDERCPSGGKDPLMFEPQDGVASRLMYDIFRGLRRELPKSCIGYITRCAMLEFSDTDNGIRDLLGGVPDQDLDSPGEDPANGGPLVTVKDFDELLCRANRARRFWHQERGATGEMVCVLAVDVRWKSRARPLITGRSKVSFIDAVGVSPGGVCGSGLDGLPRPSGRKLASLLGEIAVAEPGAVVEYSQNKVCFPLTPPLFVAWPSAHKA
ncbi:uncharacterized protein A1O5_09733 [Cladophialophora psammophila CBS 110553]|uniref:Uncharacterized protein n=1 Tax=Cladophialophora psammophila CBS 110553 TaxID=1182543 RepID=W9WG41_9EURO|nr:uncharacterized protein A1O5_09733 [Cladophialophora psammophila CBS 110553]EXJ67087.1 hypothetical protein A1O5_09733 [Cladophialophora psammophila CBS 110553]